MINKTIYIGSEHAGFFLKSKIVSILKDKQYEVKDMGIYKEEPSDIYPFIAEKVAKNVASKKSNFGILICGTGVGMCISANKIFNIRAALCHNEYTAIKSREHNNANILVIGSRVINMELAIKIVISWLSSEFNNGRHTQRVENIKKIDLKYRKLI